jgi:hypothetical protein
MFICISPPSLTNRSHSDQSQFFAYPSTAHYRKISLTGDSRSPSNPDKGTYTVNLPSNKRVFVDGAAIDALMLSRAMITLAVIVFGAELRVLTVTVAGTRGRRVGGHSSGEEEERFDEHV